MPGFGTNHDFYTPICTDQEKQTQKMQASVDFRLAAWPTFNL